MGKLETINFTDLVLISYLNSTFFHNSRALTPHILQFKGAFSPSSTNLKGILLKKNLGGATTTVSYTTVYIIHVYSQH